jgi:hypothetical protein
MVLWTVVVAVLALAVTARASHQVGELDRDGLNEQAKRNRALARYMKYNGYPDMAEVKTIVDQPPWDDHEVTLYYLNRRKEISFARARVLGRPDVHQMRYERLMTDADIRAMKSHGSRLAPAQAAPAAETTTAPTSGTTTVTVAEPSPCTGSASTRAECAAGRAEHAAERIDVAAVRAEQAAERTEAIVEKMATHRHGKRRK